MSLQILRYCKFLFKRNVSEKRISMTISMKRSESCSTANLAIANEFFTAYLLLFKGLSFQNRFQNLCQMIGLLEAVLTAEKWIKMCDKY